MSWQARCLVSNSTTIRQVYCPKDLVVVLLLTRQRACQLITAADFV